MPEGTECTLLVSVMRACIQARPWTPKLNTIAQRGSWAALASSHRRRAPAASLSRMAPHQQHDRHDKHPVLLQPAALVRRRLLLALGLALAARRPARRAAALARPGGTARRRRLACRQCSPTSAKSVECGSYYWLPNRDQMSHCACQIGPTVSFWFHL
jgi:hypothetical protein